MHEIVSELAGIPDVNTIFCSLGTVWSQYNIGIPNLAFLFPLEQWLMIRNNLLQNGQQIGEKDGLCISREILGAIAVLIVSDRTRSKI